MTNTLSLSRKNLLIGGAILAALTVLLVQVVLADVTGTLLPSSDGAYLQWKPKTGTTHYVVVDESTCNGTTDYNSTNTAGARDSYGIGLASVPNDSTITAIKITPCASNNKTGRSQNSTMNVFYRWGGVDSADAGSYALTGTKPVQLAATTFSGLSLVKGASSNLQVGAVLSAGNNGARLSRIAVVITYAITATMVPSDPSNLTTTASSSSAILIWTDNSTNEDGFKVERGTDGVNFTEIATKGINVRSHIDPGLAPSTYHYRVRAFNVIGNSGYSNTASVTIP